MSEPSIVKGTYVTILMGNGEANETFTPLCGLTTRTFTDQVNTNDSFVRDCADPEDVPTRRLILTGRQWDLSGSGLYNRAQAALVSAAVGVKKNYRFAIGEPADDAVYESYHEGPAVLTQRQITGADDDQVAAELTFASDGPWAEIVV